MIFLPRLPVYQSNMCHTPGFLSFSYYYLQYLCWEENGGSLSRMPSTDFSIPSSVSHYLHHSVVQLSQGMNRCCTFYQLKSIYLDSLGFTFVFVFVRVRPWCPGQLGSPDPGALVLGLQARVITTPNSVVFPERSSSLILPQDATLQCPSLVSSGPGSECSWFSVFVFSQTKQLEGYQAGVMQEVVPLILFISSSHDNRGSMGYGRAEVT